MTRDSSRYSTIQLQDYEAPLFKINKLEITFELEPEETLVTATLQISRTFAASRVPLQLSGDGLTLVTIQLDGQTLPPSAYRVTSDELVIPDVPQTFELTLQTRINPQANTQLSGLYLSKGIFCTQCEAHGFRRIMYFLDRPDVLTVYRTTIIADKQRYPQLLSNGNLIASGRYDDTRHFATWDDPFKKPCYLFALVAGNLDCHQDSFTTMNGRRIDLRIYVEPGNLDKCAHAVTSLKKAMRWDEAMYQREYDLDIYMIVAVSAFNMGAMENKGLNIFNDKYVLAKPDSATDQDYRAIESVIAHEYFHNWTGNRITCRDWFQLSLKEGLTVFRDQEFSRDMNDRAVNRIADVQVLRSQQFPEDKSPLAHPVRPEAYIEVNNFYTATVYNKGSEVIRMMQTILGHNGFSKGMQLYFSRHDGQAVTTDDFVAAMSDANNVDLTQFKLWYSTPGTPLVILRHQYDPIKQQVQINITQQARAVMHIPLLIGLLDQQGNDLLGNYLLEITKPQQTFLINNIATQPILSLLRDFSAPIYLQHDLSEDDLLFLLAHDHNGFARWEAGQTLLLRAIMQVMQQQDNSPIGEHSPLLSAINTMLTTSQNNHALQAMLLQLPDFNYLAEQVDTIDVAAICAARQRIKQLIGKHSYKQLLQLTNELQSFDAYTIEAKDIARRSLKNTCLDLLMTQQTPEVIELCLEQFSRANNMTDELAALSIMSHYPVKQREQIFQAFYDKWQHDELVLDKWFSIQARADSADTLERVKRLLQHPAFNINNPNRVRALIGAFCAGNPQQFHQSSGAGYEFLYEQLLRIDPVNSQVAARLVVPLTRWRRFVNPQRELMRETLERLVARTGLSSDVHELIKKSL